MQDNDGLLQIADDVSNVTHFVADRISFLHFLTSDYIAPLEDC